MKTSILPDRIYLCGTREGFILVSCLGESLERIYNTNIELPFLDGTYRVIISPYVSYKKVDYVREFENNRNTLQDFLEFLYPKTSYIRRKEREKDKDCSFSIYFTMEIDEDVREIYITGLC